MNKLIGFILICTIMISMIQTRTLAQVHMGIQFGSVSTEFEGDYFITSWDYRYIMGHSYQAGMVFDLPVKEDVSISFNPGYKKLHGVFQVGLQNLAEPDEDDESIDPDGSWVDHTKIKVDYLILPVSVKIFSNNDRWEFVSGVEPAIALAANQQDEITGITTKLEDWRKFNLSMFFGIGYRFRIGSQQFVYGVQWSQGVINITNGLNTREEFPRIKSSTYESRLIWYLPFSKSSHDIVKNAGKTKTKR